MRDIILALDRFGDQALLLGRVGENRATRILINLKSILSQYPDAIASITVKQPDRAEYPAAVKQEGGILTWEITSADIGDKAGSGQAQITIQDADGTIIKTAIATTRVTESLGSPQSPAPDPVKGWVANAEEILADVKRSGTAAQTIADEVKRKLDAGELKGDPGRDGIDGKPGKDGAAGATGATPQIKAEATTGEPGTQVSVTQSGTPENPILSFKIPRGDKGERGAKGAPGEPGKDAPQEAVLFTEQALGEAQKTRARENIGAADAAQQNILVGSEMGNPIAVDDAFSAPLCGLTVYGKSTQDGTPTPDAPVPIVSAGDDGSVTVKVTGKNLLNPALFQNNKYQSFNAETGYYEIDHSDRYWITGFQPCLPGIAYRFNVSPEGGCFYDEKKNVIGIVGFDSLVKTPVKCAYYCVNFSPSSAVYGSPVIATVSESTAYSPYREQLLTLPTPTGLPGIPVTSGGNYTDENGQQWICDEVDLERGVMVQRISSFVIDAKKANDIFVTNPYTNVTVATNARSPTPQKTSGKDRTERCVFCEALPWMYNTWGSTVNAVNYVEDNNIDFAIENSYLGLSETSTVDERKTALVKYFTDNPCRVVYRIATPIEIPLTPAEIAAYKTLTAYAPDTVVQASDGAGVKLAYQRDVNIAIKKLEDAIASMTAT